MGVVSPCSITHWLGVQGKASGSSMPAVTNRPIRMHGSAIRHHFLPCVACNAPSHTNAMPEPIVTAGKPPCTHSQGKLCFFKLPPTSICTLAVPQGLFRATVTLQSW